MDNAAVNMHVMHSDNFQLHENMPLEEALSLVTKDFAEYMNSLRSGTEQPSLGV